MKNNFSEKTDYMFNEYEIVYSDVQEFLTLPSNIQDIISEIKKLKNKLKSFGSINVDAIEEYNKVYERHNLLTTQLKDIENSKKN